MKKTTYNPRLDSTIFVTAIVLVMVALSSCSPMSSQSKPITAAEQAQIQLDEQRQATQEQKENARAINDYFLKLDAWDKVSPPVADSNDIKSTETTIVKQAPVKEGDKTSAQTCTIVEYDMVRTPDKIVMQNPAVEILYPGALIQGNGYLQGPGGVRELPIRQRAPVVITLDVPTEEGHTVIENINYANYQEAYSQLILKAKARGIKAQGGYSFHKSEVDKSEQAALNLGFSVKYLGQSLKGDLHTKSDLKEHTYMVVLEQRAFTISAMAPSSPAGFFSNDLKLEDLDLQKELKNLGEKNPPLYVSNVVYGRILMFTVTSKAKKEDIEGTLEAAYGKLGQEAQVNLQGEQRKILNEATVRVLSIGGNNTDVEALIKTNEISSYFNETPALDAYVPISYTFRNIRDNSLAKVAEATNYEKVECTPLPAKAYKVRIALEKMVVKHGWNFGNAFVYGEISLNDHAVWSNPKRSERVVIKKNDDYKFDPKKDMIEVVVSADPAEAKKNPVKLKALLRDSMSPALGIPAFTSELLIDKQENIGLTIDGRVVENKTDYIMGNNYVDIYYSVKTIDNIYE